MSRTYSTCGGDIKYTQNFSKISKGRNYLEGLGVDGKAVFKRILKGMWTEDGCLLGDLHRPIGGGSKHL